MATAIVLAAATLCGLACHARVPDFLSTNGFCIFRTTFHHTSISLVEDFMFHKFVWNDGEWHDDIRIAANRFDCIAVLPDSTAEGARN